MSTLRANNIYDSSGGSNAVLNGVASPTNSMGFRNRIINGNMRIDQRNSGAATTPTAPAVYPIDRFGSTQTQASKLTYQQVVDAPAGFVTSVKVLTAVAATPSASDQFRIGQIIEGLNCSDFGWGTAAAKTVTVSYWAKASVAGTYSVAVWNQGYNNYSYVTTVALTTSWAQYIIVIPGPTSGTWNTSNAGGIELMFDLGSGSSWTTSTLNAWQAGGAPGYSKATGSVSVVSNAGATFNLTGVQLEAGSIASPFERRPYGLELSLCQRYYWKGQGSKIYNGFGVTYIMSTTTRWPVTLRASPATVTFTSGTLQYADADEATAFLPTTNNTWYDQGVVTASAEL